MNDSTGKAVGAAPVKPVSEAVVRRYGKYRGTVLDNFDPMQTGRVKAMVPDVSGTTPTSWAEPCVPYVAGVLYEPPPIGAGVWIEYEGGDPDYPIWSGCYSLPAGQELFAAEP